MSVITYLITLREPVLVVSLEGDPNTGVAFPYLPGGVLRGALIGAYLRHHRQSRLEVLGESATRLFLGTEVRYLNGYLIDRQRQRGLPAPFSWQQRKAEQLLETEYAPATIYDFAYELPDDSSDPVAEWKGAKKPFFTLAQALDLARWLTPEKTLAVHTQRDPIYGRSTREKGAIYQYEALAAGQTFAAAIVCDKAEDAVTLLPYLSGMVNLGGSRNAGYGLVELHDAQIVPQWREAPGAVQSDSNGRFLVTLLSDALLSDANGQMRPDPQLVKESLEKRLGCSLAWYDSEWPVAFMRHCYQGGFNRLWGLPLPQVPGVAMGSVFSFALPDCPPERIAELERSGIGARRGEGFGRVAVNWQTEADWSVEPTVQTQRPEAVSLGAATPAEAVAQRMARRMLRQQIDTLVVVKGNELGRKLSINNSQLSRLRLVVQNALLQDPEDGRKRLLAYLDNLQTRPTTRRQFEKVRLAEQGMLVWLKERISDTDQIESLLAPAVTPSIGQTAAQWDDLMRYEYNLRLIDVTLAHCIKKGKEGNER